MKNGLWVTVLLVCYHSGLLILFQTLQIRTVSQITKDTP